MKKALEDLTVDVTDSIKTAMQKITANKLRAVVVLNQNKVVGIVSDGDIRRAFLRDVLPMAPVEKIMNVNCITTSDRDAKKIASTILREKITVLPIVNHKNELLDIALGYEPHFGQTETPTTKKRKRS